MRRQESAARELFLGVDAHARPQAWSVCARGELGEREGKAMGAVVRLREKRELFVKRETPFCAGEP